MAEQATDETLAELRALRAEVAALQAEVRRLESSGIPGADHGWDLGEEPREASLAWVSTLETPGARRLAVPRLALEVAFLVAVAILSVLAELEPPGIVAVMGAAWLLVTFAEWTAARADRRREELLLAPPFAPPSAPVADPAWFAPPVEHTIMQTPEEETGVATSAATLPPLAESEQTAERRPA